MKITISVLGKYENTLLVHLVLVRELIRPSNARKPSSTGVTSARFTIFSTLSFKGFSSLLKVWKIVVKIVVKSSLRAHNLNFCFTNTFCLCPKLAEASAIRSFARRILLVIAVFMPHDHMLPPRS